MSPSRIQTAAVVFRQRRAPHLEQSEEARIPLFDKSVRRVSIVRSPDSASQMQTPCCVHCTAVPQQLLFTIRHRLQALLNWVVMGCWGATPLVSLVTACIICKGWSLMGYHSRYPQPPPDAHWSTGTVIVPSSQFIFSHVFSHIFFQKREMHISNSESDHSKVYCPDILYNLCNIPIGRLH